MRQTLGDSCASTASRAATSRKTAAISLVSVWLIAIRRSSLVRPTLFDGNAIIYYQMPASNARCKHLYLDAVAGICMRDAFRTGSGHPPLDAGSSTMRLVRPSATTRS